MRLSFFHSGNSKTLWDIFLKDEARFLAAGLALGSSLILLRSLGNASTNALYCCSLTSFLSLANELLFIAALDKLPSGFEVILIGLRHKPAFVV